MTLATAAAAALRADPTLTGIVVTTQALSKVEPTEFGEWAFTDGSNGRTTIVEAVSIYEGPEVATASWRTRSRIALRMACYGPTKEAAYDVARTVRAALLNTDGETVIAGRFFEAPNINQPVLDPGYPEASAWYALLEFPTAGDWEAT